MWYHVAREYLSETVELTPKIPNCDVNLEGNIPRICVSSSIFNCLLAIQGMGDRLYKDNMKIKSTTNPCVYITEKTPFLPPDCADFRKNDERWFLDKTVFYHLGYVDAFHLFTANEIIYTADSRLRLPLRGKKLIKNPREKFFQTFLEKSLDK